jgi:hypothetical protein
MKFVLKKIAVTCLLFADVVLAQTTISNVYVQSSTASTATIVWTTSTPATSQIRYGFNNTIPFANNVDRSLVTSHSMTLTFLNAIQPYYFATVSVDGSNHSTQSATYEFALCGQPQVPVSGTINQFYYSGTYTITWNPPSGASGSPTVCGQPVATPVTGNLNLSGSFSTQVADSFKVTPGPGSWTVSVADIGNISPVTITMPLSATTQDVSTQLQAAAAATSLVGVIANNINETVYPPWLNAIATGAVLLNPSHTQTITQPVNTNFNIVTSGTGIVNVVGLDVDGPILGNFVTIGPHSTPASSWTFDTYSPSTALASIGGLPSTGGTINGSLMISTLTPGTGVVCPNGAGGALVNDGSCITSGSLLTLANTWTQQNTYNQGILLSNNAPMQANNSAGSAGNLSYVDVSNNYYFGDISNNFSGSGYWYHAGSPSLTFTSSAVTFNRPPVFGSFILNGSQSVTGVTGTSASLATVSGSLTPGHCVSVASNSSIQDSGVVGCSGSGGGGVTQIVAGTGISLSPSGGTGVVTVTSTATSGVPDVDITIPSLTIAANSSFPQYPAAASTVSMPGSTTSMVILCGFSGDPVITPGWGQVGGLKISPWVSANGTVSYRIYNQTGASITSGSTAMRCMAQ